MTSAVQGINNGPAAFSQPTRILVVDDEEMIRSLLTEILTEDGYEVAIAAGGKQAIELLQHEQFNLVISDVVMPGVNGIEVLQAAFRIDPDYPVIMITGYPSVETAVKLVNLGAADYITKPFSIDLLKVTVAKVIEKKKHRAGTPEMQTHEQPAGVDSVTGVYNLNLFRQVLQNEVGRSQLRSQVCSVLVAGIDDFQTHEAKAGHAATDHLVKIFVKAAQQQMRPGDSIGRTDQAELAIILPQTEGTEAQALAQRLCSDVRQHFKISGGIACYPRDAGDADALIQAAHAALQAARSRGGDAIIPRS